MKLRCSYCYVLIGEARSDMRFSFSFRCPNCGNQTAFQGRSEGLTYLHSNPKHNIKMMKLGLNIYEKM